MIFTADFLPHLCHHMVDVHALGRLCCANRQCSEYLLSPEGGAHWARAGKAHCGEQYWNDRLFDDLLEHEDGRYKAMLHMCPWLSVPEERDVATLTAYANLGADYELLGMKAIDCDPDGELLLKIRVKGNAHVRGGERIVSMSARDNDSPMAQVHKTEAVDFQSKTSPDELRLCEELMSDAPFMRTMIQYGLGHMGSVYIVHQNMFAFVAQNGRVWNQLSIVFVSMRQRTRALWEIRIKSGEDMGVAFLPGEMWFASRFESVFYYGPRLDKGLVAYARHEGRATTAFWAAIRGDGPHALRLMPDDTAALVLPGTDLTLFDFAAGGLGWKARADDTLPPDAQLLLDADPRFSAAVFMLKRAIFRNDLARIRALVALGRSRISHIDLYDSLGPNMQYEPVARMLRDEGVFISSGY